MTHASILLFTAIIVFSMAAVAIAQSRQGVPQGPATGEEEDVMSCFRHFNTLSTTIEDEPAKCLATIAHYMRAGCKIALTGDWRWDKWGDVVRIKYNEDYKVFVGDVKKGVEMPQGHLLFKVYFTDELRTIRQLIENAPYGEFANDNFYLNWVRQQKQCRAWAFKGTEYSIDQRTKKKTEEELWLILEGDRLTYKLYKEAWYLTRIR